MQGFQKQFEQKQRIAENLGPFLTFPRKCRGKRYTHTQRMSCGTICCLKNQFEQNLGMAGNTKAPEKYCFPISFNCIEKIKCDLQKPKNSYH